MYEDGNEVQDEQNYDDIDGDYNLGSYINREVDETDEDYSQ